MIEQVLIFAAVVAAIAIAGIGVGMLVAPRVERLADRVSEPNDEDAGDGPD
jgi:hypothetical protein